MPHTITALPQPSPTATTAGPDWADNACAEITLAITAEPA